MSKAAGIAKSFGLSTALTASAEERELLAWLDSSLTAIEAGLDTNLHYADRLADTTARYLLGAGGKRIRPLLTLLTAEYGDRTDPRIALSAEVVEMIHLATLYHDDVMDDADLRRGAAAAHTVWGNSIAILTGDLLFARASVLASELGDEILRLQARTFERLCMGQLHETTGPSADDNPVDHYIQVLADKTGSLISASAQLGILSSNGPREFLAPLITFGEKIGVAFQLIDDVIDLNGDKTGKPKGTDVRNDVQTLPILGLRAATDDESRALVTELDAALAAPDTADFDSLIDRIRASRHTAETVATAERWGAEAIAALDELPDILPTRALRRFADKVLDREL